MARNVLACESDMSCRCACCLFCIEAFSHLGYASLQEKPLHFERFVVWLDRIKGAIFSDLCYVFRVHMEHVIPEQDLLRFGPNTRHVSGVEFDIHPACEASCQAGRKTS